VRVLVTGGAGYIGSHVSRRLGDRGDEVTVLDDLSTGSRAAVPGLELIVGSITDRPALAEALTRTRPEAIVHLAALKSVEESLAEPERYFEVNVSGTLAVLGAAAEAGVPMVIYSSSCAVYGAPERTPVDETAATRPENPYGESKLLAERLLPWFEHRYGLRFAALRYFNAAGADASGDYGEDWRQAANLIPRALKAALGFAPPVQIFGSDYPTPDGTAVRDYIHIDDLAGAHLAAIDRLAGEARSLTVNVGTGHGASVREVLDAIGRVSGEPVPAVLASRREGDPAMVWADPAAARRLLGWRSRYGLDETIESAWNWHRRHPDGYGEQAGATGEQPAASVAGGGS
jgi:UDP-glucose-4-epimerase GalE